MNFNKMEMSSTKEISIYPISPLLALSFSSSLPPLILTIFLKIQRLLYTIVDLITFPQSMAAKNSNNPKVLPSISLPHLYWHKCAVGVEILRYILEYRFVSNDVESIGLPVVQLFWKCVHHNPVSWVGGESRKVAR